jgi:anti-anti-sigma factor
MELLCRGLAIVRVTGEQDLACYDRLKDTLDMAVACGDILVDLTNCTCIDSGTIGALIAAHGGATAQGHRLAMLIRPQPDALARTIKATRLADIIPVHTSRNAAFAVFRPQSRRLWSERNAP